MKMTKKKVKKERPNETTEEYQIDEAEGSKSTVGNEDLINSKIQLINLIQEEVENLHKKVDEISSNVKDYDYLYCEEMLTKCLLKLDNILADGEDTIRTARKNVVKEINIALQQLEEKLS